MFRTQTGNIAIGFREVGSWNVDFETVVKWAQANGFSVIDIAKDGTAKVEFLMKSGLRVGAVDLPQRDAMITSDQAKRKDAVAENTEFISSCTGVGVKTFFTMMLPENIRLSHRENYDLMVSGYADLNEALERCDGRIAIEGWPGPGCVCCTPEGYRKFLKDCGSDRIGINYDPSHLIRMGIDPLRFLAEFSRHCHF